MAPRLAGAAGLLALEAAEVVLSRQSGWRLGRCRFAVPAQPVCKEHSSGLERNCLLKGLQIEPVSRQATGS